MKNFTRFLVLCIALVMVLGSVGSFAASYTSYTYAYDGSFRVSPDGYSPDRLVDGAYMGGEVATTPLNEPTDIVVDSENGNVYIADPNNARIVVLDRYYKYIGSMKTFINDQGVEDALATPNGLCVTKEFVYVADTANKRILKFKKFDLSRPGKTFDSKYPFVARYEEPVSDSFSEGSEYMPIAIAANEAGRMYVVSAATFEGIIALNVDGTFSGFVGAQKVSYNAFELMWRKFQTKEQREASESYISTEYNNVDIDADGFVYATTASIDEAKLESAIQAKDKTSDYAPVKKLNTAGDDIMRRNGFYPPSGEINIRSNYGNSDDGTTGGPSTIVDVAIGPEGTWTILDSKRCHIFTYDADGELLFAFGDKGDQLGNLRAPVGVAYQSIETEDGKAQDAKLLVLDKTLNAVTVYNRTEYGDILVDAIKANNDRRYDEASDNWKKILQRNNNFDSAYVGLGKAAYRKGDWEGAMEYYKACYDTTDYSEAYKMWRKDWVTKYIWTIPLAIIVIILIISKTFGHAGKVNRRVAVSGEKRKFSHELWYGFHLIFHPFDGFWDLKHEKRGSARAATVYLVLAILAFMYNGIGQSFLFAPHKQLSGLIMQISGVALPVLLWVAANWCLTTLFEGEGSVKDIYIATCYAILPIPLLLIPATLLTHILTLDETGFVTLLTGFMWVWTFLLVFFGCMVTHDYSLGKNILTCIATIGGMAVIMFLGVLFSALVTKMVAFVMNIVTEITYRM